MRIKDLLWFGCAVFLLILAAPVFGGQIDQDSQNAVHGHVSDTYSSKEVWQERLLWAVVGWAVFATGEAAIGTIKKKVVGSPDMTRAGMWFSSSQVARLFIDATPSRPILFFLGREGFLLKNVFHGRERWHGEAFCFNTGVRSGDVTIDGPRNALVVRFDRVSGQKYEVAFERVQAEDEQKKDV